VSHASGLQFVYLEDGQELVLADLEKSVALAFIHFFQLENVLVKGNRFRHIVHLDREMIDSVNPNAHGPSFELTRLFSVAEG
jgi:hypothetical protein